MRIVIFGAGGVGGYFGGLLAKRGHSVTLIARGEHLRSIQSGGLHVISPAGNFHIHRINATDNPVSIGYVDAVIVAVKGWQLKEAAEQIRPMLGPESMVLPLLNGVDAPALLAAELGADRVLGGLCGIMSLIDSPGVIRHVDYDPFITLGEPNGKLTARAKELASVLSDADINTTLSDNITRAMWNKFLYIAPTSGVTSVARVPIDVVRDVPETRALLEAAVREVIAVGSAVGQSFVEEDFDRVMEIVDSTPVGGTTSMQRDIQKGNRAEVETQTGTVVRYAQRTGIAVPVNQSIYAALLPQQLSVGQ